MKVTMDEDKLNSIAWIRFAMIQTLYTTWQHIFLCTETFYINLNAQYKEIDYSGLIYEI